MTDKLKPEFNRSGSETRKRGPSVRVRVSIEEQAIIRERAERAGLSVSGYIREAVLDAPTTRAIRQPRVNRKLAAQLLESPRVYWRVNLSKDEPHGTEKNSPEVHS